VKVKKWRKTDYTKNNEKKVETALLISDSRIQGKEVSR
jgi:hypothetical protein